MKQPQKTARRFFFALLFLLFCLPPAGCQTRIAVQTPLITSAKHGIAGRDDVK